MSQMTNDETKDFEAGNPEEDARIATRKKDFRLLGFSTRVTTVPGIASAKRQASIEQCGLRLLKGFGDVIKSEKQGESMKKAYDYASRYNQIIIQNCLKN